MKKKVVIHNWGGSTSFYLIYLFAYSLINFYYLVRYFCACMSKVLLKEKLNHESSMIVKEKKRNMIFHIFSKYTKMHKKGQSSVIHVRRL